MKMIHPGGRGEERERLKIGRGKKEVQNPPARSFSEYSDGLYYN